MEYLDSNNLKLIKGIVVCKESGEYLVDLILDSNINPILLSGFVGALSLFGKENLGKIKEIQVKGLDVDMIVVSKHNLILVAIMDKELLKNGVHDELEGLLDIFYSCYQDEIKDNIEVMKFNDFKEVLFSQIQEYLDRLKNGETTQAKVGDFGFITEIIKKMKYKNC